MSRARFADVAADAWALWRRDSGLLTALAGPVWFLPSLALALLVPSPPPLPAQLDGQSPEAMQWADRFGVWLTGHGWWFVVAGTVALWGTATVWALYLDRDRPDVLGAFARAGRLLPRLFLLQLLIAPFALMGLILWLVPLLLVLARTAAAGPAIVAERPLGAVAALARSLRVTRGATLSLMTVQAALIGLAWIVPQPLLGLDTWLRAQDGGANPVALAMVDAGVATLAAAAALASSLVGVAVYRRLAESEGLPPSP